MKGFIRSSFPTSFSSVIRSEVIINLVLKALTVHSLLSLFQLIITF